MINTGFQKSLTGLQSKMLNFAYTLTSNRDDAQDLTQDTTLKALTNEKSMRRISTSRAGYLQ